MSARAYALSDGNSFYCSCERVFDARLAKVPVIVLSNNDGCAIARTPEAKALGIRMGEPYFRIRDMCRVQGVRVYSSNYALYGDMSARVNTVYRGFSPRIEVYSIDESFLDLSDVREAEWVTLCRDMRETVRAWTGIPTCVGIGATKTLAKLANHVAKKVPELGGVCDLTDPIQYDHWMARIPPEDIWGVGPANARKLEALGCESVADVRDLDTRAVRKAMTVVGERLVQELRGMACLDLEEVAPTRKGCAVTRSFSDRVEDLATMEQAVATHAARLGEKLRAGGLATDHVTVFFHTSEHDRDRPQRSVSSVVTLPEASNDTLVLVKACLHGVRKTWRDGYRYSKAGVVTTDLVPLATSQRAFLGLGQIDREHGAALMGALDTCNRRFGRGAVVPGSAGFAPKREWSTHCSQRPCITSARRSLSKRYPAPGGRRRDHRGTTPSGSGAAWPRRAGRSWPVVRGGRPGGCQDPLRCGPWRLQSQFNAATAASLTELGLRLRKRRFLQSHTQHGRHELQRD